jgi:cobyrinic acid a,c-diamide synthase
MQFPRLMIAGVHSSSGKTTVSLGLMTALKRRHIKVQPFKVGPDYIDPGLHSHASGRSSHNLDSWMMPPEVIQTVFARNAANAEISIIEGVMGLFDGYRGERIAGSSAEVALLLKIPVVLVVDVKAMSQSCVPLVKGFMEYQPGVEIKGVVLNHASQFHQQWVAPNLEEELGVKVLGCVPREESISIPERHLGLLPADEHGELASQLNKMADLLEAHLGLEAVLALSREASPLPFCYDAPQVQKRVTIGIARDAAFSFYYQDSLDYLSELGAELKYFSPLNDSSLPEVDGIYIGGGFPEMFLPQLSRNSGMKEAINQAYRTGMPILAECGGLMYLSRSIKDWEGKSWPGVGLVPGEVIMTRRLQELGYVQATALKDTVIAGSGEELRGHEFHYSTLEGINPQDCAFECEGGMRPGLRRGGYAQGSLLASYLHLQLRANPTAAQRFIARCLEYRNR